jgi:hypothetical protein
MTKTRTQVTAVLAAAAVVLAVIFTAAPHAIVVTSASGEVVSIDILGLTKNATNLAEQQFPAY